MMGAEDPSEEFDVPHRWNEEFPLSVVTLVHPDAFE